MRVAWFVARSAVQDLGDSEVPTIEQNDDPGGSGGGYPIRRHSGDDQCDRTGGFAGSASRGSHY